MKILLDTHFLIWLACGSETVTPTENALIDDNRRQLSVSIVSLWEVRMKWDTIDRNGVRKGVLNPVAAAEFCDDAKIVIAPLTREMVSSPFLLSTDHADPFDRMLLVHAQHLGARLLTRDRKLLAHPLSLPL